MTDAPRPAPSTLAGRRFDWGSRTYLMGILNLTSDSFAGDGLGTDLAAALLQAQRFAAEGADILDLGAESTRPGFTPVSAEQQLARLLPLLQRLPGVCDLPLSVDTTSGEVARATLAAGASLINDTAGLRGGSGVAAAVADAGAAAVVMHNQRDRSFHDVIADVRSGLAQSFAAAAAAGLPRERLIIDPGLGFGWEPPHNLELVRRLGELRDLGRPILIGPSRKSMIGWVLDASVDQRLEGTAALVALAIANGADIVRVHDVGAMSRVARMTDAVLRGWTPPDA